MAYDEALRLYTFTNFYLSSIQQGIQSGHAAVELFVKYQITKGWKNGEAQMLNEWAANHKTMICLNGGDLQGVMDIAHFFDSPVENPFPWAPFYEDSRSLGNIMTSVAIILPANIYETADLLRKKDDKMNAIFDTNTRELRVSFASTATEPGYVRTFSQWEADLMRRLGTYSLAR